MHESLKKITYQWPWEKKDAIRMTEKAKMKRLMDLNEECNSIGHDRKRLSVQDAH